MNRRGIIFSLTVSFLAACATSQSPTPTLEPTQARPTWTPPPPATAVPTISPVILQVGEPLSEYQGRYFSASGVCTPCHQNQEDDSGSDVSIDAFWRSSVMANSARDPFWQASVRSEIVSRPDAAASIENTCAKCHMPMARYTDSIEGGQAGIFGPGLMDPDHPLNDLAMDGVSCTLCHQVLEEGLGFQTSYNGGFEVDIETAPGERLIYGPYSVDDPSAIVMQQASGYVPTQGMQLGDSELCATCHTFFAGSEFPIQTTYFEWFYSDSRGVQTCQDCHMPEAVGGVRIASSSEFPRSPFAEHLLVGGNAYILELLKTFVDELGLTASAEQFEVTRQRTVEQLQNQAVELEIDEMRLSGGRLTADIRIKNLAGHKFPSGFPSRRAWIRFVIEDSSGQIVFESGGVDALGRIVDNDGDDDPTLFEPHYLAIVQPEQVQIYESIMSDANGKITTELMAAAEYLKDNRIMPAGQDKFGAVESIQPRGKAVGDEDFQGGVDGIQYAIDLRQEQGPFTVTIEVLYQSVAHSWIEAMRDLAFDEVERFLRLYDAVPNVPVVVARESVEIGE
ncbi:MAG: hypothetical protein BMS9Abin28_0240 [Anaerolineae bacterium]|nr:MAG: hypothetical protein BMS9Abin28_0240 [Anaerolineae bacterium]